MLQSVSTIERTPGGRLASVPDFSLDARAIGNQLRITLLGAGAAPFRRANAALGSIDFKNVASLSLQLVASTLGTANAVPFRLWVVVFDDAGSLKLGVINCLTTTAGAGAGRDVAAIYPLTQFGIASSTALAAGSNLSQTFYTNGGAVASKPYRTVGYITYENGLAAAGTYDVDPTRVHAITPNDPLPGQRIQVQRSATGAVATGATVMPPDDSIPQNNEGDQYLSQAITPTSAANVLEHDVLLFLANNQPTPHLQAALFQDTTANALVATDNNGEANAPAPVPLRHKMLSGTTAATTFKVRAGGDAAGTTTFNGAAAGRRYGGVANSFLEVGEVMA